MAKTNAMTEWLDIPADEQPPNHYRLLGLKLFTSDEATIAEAAEKSVQQVREKSGGKHRQVAEKLIAMVRAAATCLKDPDTRAEYDANLRQSLGLKPKAAEPKKAGKPAIDSLPEPVELSEVVVPRSEPSVSRKRRKKSGTMLTIIAAVAGGVVATALVFSGVIPLGNDKDDRNNDADLADGNVGKSPKGNRPGKSGNTVVGKKSTDGKQNPKKSTTPKNPGKKNVAKNDGPVFLAKLKPAESNQADTLNRPFKIQDKTPQHGLWMQPVKDAPGKVVYDLNGRYKWFRAIVTIPDGSPGERKMIFRITGDGKKLWESPPLQKPGTAESVALGVAGVKRLEITARSEDGDVTGAQAVLLNAQVLKPADRPQILTLADVLPPTQPVGANNPDKEDAVDLLKLIDPAKHAPGGTWSIKDGKLATSGGDVPLQIPYTPPAEYELRFNVTRKSSVNPTWLNIALVAEGRQFWAVLGHDTKETGPISALYQLDGKHVARSETAVKADILKVGEESEITCRVTKAGVQVIVDGRTLIDWKGSFSRLSHSSQFRYQLPDKKQLGIGCHAAFEFSKFELRPLKKEEQVVDLLKRIDLSKDSLGTKWTLDKDGLESQGGPSYLELPYEVPEEYEFHLTATRLPKHQFDALIIGLSGGGRHFQVMIDHGGRNHGLYNLDGQGLGYYQSAFVREGVLKDGVPANIVCTVTKEGVKVAVDGRTLFDWKGEFTRLSSHKNYNVAKPRYLAVGAPTSTRFRFSKLEVRPIKSDSKLPAGTEVVNKNRHSIPDAAKQQKALALIKDIFKKEYAGAKSNGTRSQLAKKLIVQSQQTVDDTTGKFVLLSEAHRLALEAGDSLTALEAVDLMAAEYEVDKVAKKTETLKKLVASVRITSQARTLVAALQKTAKQAVNEERYDEAIALLRDAGGVAGKFRLRSQVKELSDYRTKVVKAKNRFDAAAQAAETLKTNPDDPDANLVSGRYLCFTKDDWNAGLPRLAKGKDETLVKLAERETANPNDPKEMVSLGDDWYAFSKRSGLPKEDKTGAVVRAVTWYRHALPSLTGLYKTKVEKTLAEIDRLKLVPFGRTIGTITPIQQPKVTPKSKQTGSADSKVPLYVWEVIGGRGTPAGKQNLRVEFYANGKTNHGHPWKLDGSQFSCGWESGGSLYADGTFAIGRWFRGAYYTARLLMRNASLTSEPAARVEYSKTAGQTAYGSFPAGSLDKTIVDCWEFAAATRSNRNWIRTTVDFTADHNLIDGGRKIGTWEMQGRKVSIKFLDEKFGTVSLGLKNPNELIGRAGGNWTLQFTRVQKVAVYRTEQMGTLTFYSNGRLNKPRHEIGDGDFHWVLTGKRLWLHYRGTVVSTDGKTLLGSVKGTFLSGRPLKPVTK